MGRVRASLGLILLAAAANAQTIGPPIRGQFTVSSPFGDRSDPMGGGDLTVHAGVDLVAPAGTRIVAAADGVVVTHYPPPGNGFRGHPSFGGFIVIKHEDPVVFYTRYAHMSRTFVREGLFVRAGQEIGVIGSTGKSTGRHLHFEVLFDPMTLLRSEHENLRTPEPHEFYLSRVRRE